MKPVRILIIAQFNKFPLLKGLTGVRRTTVLFKWGIRSKFSSAVERKSPFADIAVEEKCFQNFYLEKFEKFGSSIAFVNTENSQKITYIELFELCHRLAHGIHHTGLQKGDRVTLCLPNSPEFVVALLGVQLAGGIPSPINPEYTAEELASHLKISQPSFLFVREENLQKVLQTVEKVQYRLKHIYVVNQIDPIQMNNVSSIKSLLSNTASQHIPTIAWHIKEDLALLPFSSGTTGLPKGIMISHYNLTSLVQILYQPSRYDVPKLGDHMVSALPFYHIFGAWTLFMTLGCGATMWTMPKFKKHLYLKIIQDKKVPVLYVVPPILNYWAKEDEVKNYDLSSVRTCFCAAAPIGKEIIQEIERKFPTMRIVQGYGMTEMSGVSHIMPKIEDKIQKYGSCGMLLSNFETKVVNTETGEELRHNEVGELCVKGQTCMLGYYENQEATNKIYDSEQFLHTGDLGYYDTDHHFYIIDRLKELIKVRGFQVAPAELEGLLLSHTDVKDAAVIGIPDQSAGEVPKAFVVLKNASCLSECELLQYVNTKVTHYKHLKGGIEFVKEIPKSPSGKILRRLLKNRSV